MKLTETLATKDTYLVEDGRTSYQIVLPETKTKELEFAAEELQYFFKLITGTDLTVISELEVTDTKGKYLSIGETKIAKESGVDYSYATVGFQGCCVKTHGDAIVMVGGSDQGSIYAVYDYLKLQFDLEIYTEDVFKYNTTSTFKLIDVDVTDVPDIPIRSAGTRFAYEDMADYKARQRYRMTSRWSSWGLWGHTHFLILPPSKYAKDHPDWYNEKQSQLAWENEEMWDTFAENLKQIIIKSNPRHEYFMLGQEDNVDLPCHDRGKWFKVKTKYGEQNSGVQLAFLNYVVKKINAWMAEEMPNRKAKFYMFAYEQTEDPPVCWDEQKKAYVLASKDLVIEDNFGVQLAPIVQKDSQHAYTAVDPETGRAASPDNKRTFEGWAAICKTLTVWGYSTSFRDGLHPFNGFYTFKQNYMTYKDIGVDFLFEQGAISWVVGNFMELRQYLISKLAWDTSLDTETLIVNFFKAYYRDGWENMYTYFHLIHERQLELTLSDYRNGEGYFVTTNSNLSIYYKDWIMQPNCFPFGLIEQCEKEIALAIEKAKAANDEKAVFAMEVDRLPLRYLALTIHKNRYEPTEYIELVRDFERLSEKIGMIATDESRMFPIAKIIEKWLDKEALPLSLNNSEESEGKESISLALKTEMKTEYKVGERLQLPEIVKTDNATLRVYMYCPNSSLWCLKNPENVVFEETGRYKIKFFAYDEDYNYVEKSFIVFVR